jgi:hypothetical protein
MEETINYSDSVDLKNSINELYEQKTYGDVINLIQKLFPNWIVGYAKKYSENFDILNKNWNSICKICKVDPIQVIIVQNVFLLSDTHTCIQNVCEFLTRLGFSVRTESEIYICKKCECALPTQKMEELILLKYPNFYKKNKICCE